MKSELPPDFQALFESAPDLYMVLSPSFKIVAVSNAYLQATLAQRENVIGRGLFEVFPDNPDDPAADGVRNLRLSIEQVLLYKKTNAMAVQKYDVRNAQGQFEERYWSPVNIPVFDANGIVAWILHRAVDVTEMIHL
jgi:PAS domain S-box-containing protein